jgi:hypothetical protein
MVRTSLPLFGIALFVTAIAVPTRLGGAAVREVEHEQHEAQNSSASSTLVERVREATDAFRTTIPAEYQQFLGCVSGPEAGAMGVHFVNFSLVDDKIEVTRPEVLIYDLKNGRARLVGVEYIAPAAAWDADPAHSGPPPVPPVLEGQVFHFNESPNRFRLPAFYELHVWAWRDNPNGAFADWNTRVSCDGL